MKDWTNSKVLLWTYCIIKEFTVPTVAAISGWIILIELLWMVKS